MDLKERIELVLSEILSDKHECNIVLRFEAENVTREEDIDER